MEPQKGIFVCTECGSFESAGGFSRPPSSDDRGPWSGVRDAIRCARCGYGIPAHLGERWDGMTIEQARETWLRVFRPTASRGPVPRSPLGADLNRVVVVKSTIEELRLRGRGLYRVVREIDYHPCYRSFGGGRRYDDLAEPLETYSSEYLCDGDLA
jgi:hypothetical protein